MGLTIISINHYDFVQEWRKLIHTSGLVIVDVYCGWFGPCSPIENYLKKLRLANVNNMDR